MNERMNGMSEHIRVMYVQVCMSMQACMCVCTCTREEEDIIVMLTRHETLANTRTHE